MATETELSPRKVTILMAIIKSYLETGEPVGSRTISKETDLNLSSATIRNEMSDLEDLGYIIQPHTSAGRIPSDKGYRFYVDHLMESKDKEVQKMQEFYLEKTEKMEHLLKQVVKVIANNTQYATMMTTSRSRENVVKFVQLSMVHDEQLLAVVVMENNMVKNRIIPLDEPIDAENLLKLNMILNSSLNGLSVNEINLSVITAMKDQAGVHEDIIGEVIDTVAATISTEEEVEVYTSGATNILKYPELSDSGMSHQLLEAFEEKSELASLFADDGENETGIQVYIGSEAPSEKMKDCSVVTATYELGDGVKGTIGIVGPKRMDYDNVVSNLRNLKGQLDQLFKDNK
ncbi:MAG: heat-inducible transcriptional repressor HrcA [Lachnospiraceae bacterium]|nr:heat-inducible transcriptional repressor HrcA [Lachnospiraceae bacterium]